MALAHRLATIGPSDVTEEELQALDAALNEMADAAEFRREDDLIEFLTSLSESLKQGSEIALYATEGG